MSASHADNFRDRLKLAAGRVGGVDELAKAAGIARRTFGNYLAGRNEPKRPQLVAIARAAGVSLAWLASGEGQMGETARMNQRRNTRAGLEEPSSPSFLGAPTPVPDAFLVLPRDPRRAAPIPSGQLVDVLAFRRDWLERVLRLDPDNLALISAVGDSMVPTIEEGDLLLLDLSSGRARDNALYALGVNGALVVKRLQLLTNGGLRIISDNPAYPPEEIPAGEAGALNIVGRVVWHGAPA